MSECTSPEIGRLIHAYELKQLSEQETERFEIHLMECEHCFAEVQTLDKTATLMGTDPEIRSAVREVSEKDSLQVKIANYLWPDTIIPLKPAITYLVILLLAYPAYLGIRGAGSGEARQVQTIFMTSTRSASAEIATSHLDLLVSFEFPGAEPGETYRVVVASAEGHVIFEDDSFAGFDKHGFASLLIPRARLRPGTYSLLIENPEAKPPFNRRKYTFEVEIE